MEVELWGHSVLFYFAQPMHWATYSLLLVYVIGWLVLVVRCRREFLLLRGRQLLLLLFLLVLTPLANNLLLLRIRPADLPPPPYQAAQPAFPTVPLLGLLPVVLAGLWTGVGPASLLGLIAGIVRAGTTSHSLLDPFTLAFEAALIAYLLRQDYAGRAAQLFRYPAVGVPCAATVVFPLTWLSLFLGAYRPGGGLVALDYTWTVQRYLLGLHVLEAAMIGLALQTTYLVGGERVRPVVEARRTPPYARSLSRRFFISLLPLLALLIVVLIYAVSYTAIRIAEREAIDAMRRDAFNGADRVATFITIGRSLIRQFGTDSVLWEGGESLCEDRLRRDYLMLPYFSRLTAYGPAQEVLCTFPEGSEEDTGLVFEEEALADVVFETGGSGVTPAYLGVNGAAYVSFLSPLEDPQTGERHGMLVGRADLSVSPTMADAVQGLQRTMQYGEGFVVDERGYVIAHVDKERLLQTWQVDQTVPPLAEWEDGRGWVRESRDSLTNARQFVCQVGVEGHPWSVVIRVPYAVVLGRATSIAAPLFAGLLFLAGVASLVFLVVVGRLTRPLNLLAAAAGRIAAGDLEHPVHVYGEDEVGQLAAAFEKMRVSLKARLEDLSLLLRVSQAVSASLDLAKGLPPILEGALQATGALVARMVLFSSEGEPQWVMGRGESIEGIGLLDRAISIRARDAEGPVQVEDPEQVRALAPGARLPDPIQSAIAFTVRSQKRTVGVLWVGCGEPRRFAASEVDLLRALVSQTAVLLENARLFQMAEGGRRRLSAILASTRDAILVTDRQDRLLLINPAAEQALELTAGEVVGRPVAEIPLDRRLAQVLTAPFGQEETLVVEVPLPNGRVYYASAAPIYGGGGEAGGRVVVLRDITHFKELDEMKSEFVATVSHDLRAPLTFMRGYASMLSTVGPLNDKQQEYVEKILRGVEQMSRLVEDLLSLGRIEAGVGLEKEPCHLGALVAEAVDSMRAHAVAKGLSLRMEASQPAPVIMGDATLLRQAVVNLVDNAIKYTPSGGVVTVRLHTTDQEVHVSVIDTGIGIAPEDQVRLFEKFYRVRRRDAGDVGGTGLGLAIVRSIVERHGGRVWVKSAPNQGSTFTIALPLRSTESEDA